MSAIRNEMILASAGSGKTYELTTRFIALLAAGVPPERIAALTFTRKAAGEFFDEILTRLAKAAANTKEASQLAAAIGQPKLGCAEFGAMLRSVVDAMPRLTLGTMDGFFARVVRAFPFELGLAGDLQILDSAAAAEEVRRVLGRLFSAQSGRGEGRDALLEAFKLATIGIEVKAVTRLLDQFLDEYLELFRSVGDVDAWGNVGRIWPWGFPWGDGGGDPARRIRIVRDWIASEGDSMTPKLLGRWEDFASACEEWGPGTAVPRSLSYVIERVLEAQPGFGNGVEPVKVDRKEIDPPAEVREAIVGLVHRVIALELGRRIAATRGIASLLAEFDSIYDAGVRRSGRLTFHDVLELLRESRVLGRGEGAESAMRAVEFRLDGRIDHWLLDEFQDTSRRQWEVLEGLVDEAVQDPTGTRTFFYVGDIKQAIFGWRGGDPRLFKHVFQRYAAGGTGAIHARELNRSYRSGEAIMELVNRVFGSSAALGCVFPDAAGAWGESWRTHQSAVPERKGQAAVLVANDEQGRFQTALDLIRSLEPMRRGFSCAALVQDNDTATRFAEFLRKEGGVAAVAEADLKIGKDNPWSATFTSLLRAAAHPGDLVSWQHLLMTPAREWLGGLGVTTPDALSQFVLGELGERGYEELASTWTEGMRPFLGKADGFSRRRADQMIGVARAFDESGGGSVAAFLRCLDSASIRESEGDEVVRVMTIHKSKGLGFDVVILPDLEGTGLAQRRDGPAVSRRDDGTVEWALQYPGGWIAEHDSRLKSYLASAKAEAAFESVALLYVAMTRAKRGLFAVVQSPGKSSACSYPCFLTQALGSEVREISIGAGTFAGVFAEGDSEWLESGQEVGKPEAWKPDTVDTRLAMVRPARKVASGSLAERESVVGILGDERATGAEHGIEVHELLSGIEWLDGLDVEDWAESARKKGFSNEAISEVRGTLGSKDLLEVFQRPGEGWEVWRERAFEMLFEGTWVSGVIDRACVSRAADGQVQAIRVYDFKSDSFSDGPTGMGIPTQYLDQIALYRRVLAAATGLDVQRVRAELVLTRGKRLFSVEGTN